MLIDEGVAAASDTVTIGSKVGLTDERGERMEIEISSAGGVSPDSPLGRALLGARVGDERDVEAPSGRGVPAWCRSAAREIPEPPRRQG